MSLYDATSKRCIYAYVIHDPLTHERNKSNTESVDLEHEMICCSHLYSSLSILLHHYQASIPAFFFNYSCNYQLLTVHNALAIKSTKTSNLAIGNTMIIITTIYIVLGLTTYRTFGADLESNFLGNYGNNVVIDLVRLFIILSVALLFPLTIFTARASVMSILGPAYVTKFNSKHVFFTISLLLVAFAYVVAISVANLNVILGVGGALSTVPITLVLPGSYTASLAEKGPAGDGDRRKGRVAMITGYVLTFLCLYGALAMRN